VPNFADRGYHSQRDGSLRPYSRLSRPANNSKQIIIIVVVAATVLDIFIVVYLKGRSLKLKLIKILLHPLRIRPSGFIYFRNNHEIVFK
jgi:hypothetical protein